MATKMTIEKPYQVEIVIPNKRKWYHYVRGQRYHWRIRALNGKIIQSGEPQHNLVDVRDGANRFALATGLTVVEVTE